MVGRKILIGKSVLALIGRVLHHVLLYAVLPVLGTQGYTLDREMYSITFNTNERENTILEPVCQQLKFIKTKDANLQNSDVSHLLGMMIDNYGKLVDVDGILLDNELMKNTNNS